MTPAAIVAQAAAAGVHLTVTDTGTIRAHGDRDAIDHWLPIIRAHKSALLTYLARDAEPRGACPACGCGQWWQPRDGGAWHCRHCNGDAMPLTATTLTLPCSPTIGITDE